MTAVSSVFVSVVCRLRDERDLVESLLEDLTRVLRANYENWEIVLVDDGSRDGTTARVKELLGRYEGVRLLRLSRAFGLDVAITAGLESAIGDVVVTLSAETDPPDLIPQLVELARRDNAAVYGVAPSRRRGFLRESGARVFYWMCRSLLVRMVGWIALGASFLNLVYIGYVFAVRIFKTRVAEGWMTLSLQNAGMFLLLFLILAVVTEYVGRILDETRERPLYYIAEEANSSVMVPSAERRNVVRESR